MYRTQFFFLLFSSFSLQSQACIQVKASCQHLRTSDGFEYKYNPPNGAKSEVTHNQTPIAHGGRDKPFTWETPIITMNNTTIITDRCINLTVDFEMNAPQQGTGSGSESVVPLIEESCLEFVLKDEEKSNEEVPAAPAVSTNDYPALIGCLVGLGCAVLGCVLAVMYLYCPWKHIQREQGHCELIALNHSRDDDSQSRSLIQPNGNLANGSAVSGNNINGVSSKANDTQGHSPPEVRVEIEPPRPPDKGVTSQSGVEEETSEGVDSQDTHTNTPLLNGNLKDCPRNRTDEMGPDAQSLHQPQRNGSQRSNGVGVQPCQSEDDITALVNRQWDCDQNKDQNHPPECTDTIDNGSNDVESLCMHVISETSR